MNLKFHKFAYKYKIIYNPNTCFFIFYSLEQVFEKLKINWTWEFFSSPFKMKVLSSTLTKRVAEGFVPFIGFEQRGHLAGSHGPLHSCEEYPVMFTDTHALGI
jgi:hypothetical protein